MLYRPHHYGGGTRMEEIVKALLGGMAEGTGVYHTEDCWTNPNNGCEGTMEVDIDASFDATREGPHHEVDGVRVRTFQEFTVLKCDTCGSVRYQRDGLPYYMQSTTDGWNEIVRFRPSKTSQ